MGSNQGKQKVRISKDPARFHHVALLKNTSSRNEDLILYNNWFYIHRNVHFVDHCGNVVCWDSDREGLKGSPRGRLDFNRSEYEQKYLNRCIVDNKPAWVYATHIKPTVSLFGKK